MALFLHSLLQTVSMVTRALPVTPVSRARTVLRVTEVIPVQMVLATHGLLTPHLLHLSYVFFSL